ncbi:hypothetical protein D3C75_440360 [compost metagenome]
MCIQVSGAEEAFLEGIRIHQSDHLICRLNEWCICELRLSVNRLIEGVHILTGYEHIVEQICLPSFFSAQCNGNHAFIVRRFNQRLKIIPCCWSSSAKFAYQLFIIVKNKCCTDVRRNRIDVAILFSHQLVVQELCAQARGIQGIVKRSHCLRLQNRGTVGLAGMLLEYIRKLIGG